ncbi:Cytochrome P450 [Amycolatopsis xylanica]|uniref:Cytochrome P450 n=1 Tax=Amycolatopsis xylanica TaxID=589385 RepID=A0A1H3K4E2_9PSEU|nr:cytochrome P450 [Amycolatopsis xylanica]SDY47046.1 Cytochrome P450 [Amycolatopsis xylanica]
MRFSNGVGDPRLLEVDADFQAVLDGLSPLVDAARMTRARTFHKNATTAAGTLKLNETLDLPAHDFLRPGREFDVLARYSNGVESDDIAPSIRGITLRLRDPGTEEGLLDLSLNTGELFFLRTADMFLRYSNGEADDIDREVPDFKRNGWRLYRYASTFADYHYYSQAPTGYIAADGTQYLVRYRLLPATGAPDTGHVDFEGRGLPPEPPAENPRDPGDIDDPRPKNFLHLELRERILEGGPIGGTLQVQLHPVTESDEENELALDCMRPWDLPWIDLATLQLDSLVTNAKIEGLRFSPAVAPESLGSVLATSPYENASLNHLRVLLYSLSAAARLEEPAEPAPKMIGCPFSGHSTEDSPKRTIAVIGAGPAGLSAARELERAGHRAIVLEALPEVGGKCESVDIDDRAYDLGGHVCTTQYANVAQLAAELGMPTEDTTPHRVYDLDDGEAKPQSTAFFRRETFGKYAELRDRLFPQIAEPGLAHSARSLAQPVSQWLTEQGLESLAESLGIGYTSAGYGYLAGDLPALYFVKYAEMTGLLSAKPELLGHTGSFTILGGFKGLWEKVAAQLSDVRCGTTISAIDRDLDAGTGGVRITTDQGVVTADDLVLTVPLDQLLPVLDATPEERDLAGRVRVMDYYTTVITATGLPRSAFYLVDQHTRPSAARGHAVAFHHRYPDQDVYACYSYGEPGLDGDDIVIKLRENVERMGGELVEVHTQRRWRFLPHFGSEDILDGVYDRIEHLQGQRHTFHAGSLPAYELVECTVAYSRKLVREHFDGGDDVFGHFLAAPTEQPVLLNRPEPTVDALRDWLIENVAAELRLPADQVGATVRLDRFALESMSVAALQSGLSDWLGFRIPHTLFLEHPTIDSIARHLAVKEEPAESTTTTNSTLLLGLTAARPFFCVGGALGAAYYLLQLARDVGSARPFYGVRAPGYDGSEDPLDTVEELAARYIESIRLVQPYGPYLLGGHSFGGVVAYEMGRQLREAGEEVTRIVLLDSYVPIPGQPLPPEDDAAAIEELLTMNRLAFKSGGPAGVEIDPELAVSEQKERLGRFLGANGSLPVEEHIGNMLRVYQANIEANVKYQPRPSDLKVTLLKAMDGFPPVMKPHRNTALKLDLPANGWEEVELGELDLVEIPGDHFTMFVEPNDEKVAAAVHTALSDEERRSANTLIQAESARSKAETTIAFNPLDPAFLNDPYPFYRALRESAPIHYEDTVGGWIFTRYDDVSKLLRNHAILRPPVTDYLFASVPQVMRDRMANFERQLGLMLPFANPPYHTRVRRLMSKAFTPKLIESYRPQVEAVTDRLLDRIEADGGGDLMTAIAYPLPSTVIMEFIGVPREDHARMTHLSTEMMQLLGAQYAKDAPAIASAAHVGLNEFNERLIEIIGERRREPKDDLLSTLVTLTGPDGKLTDEELILNCMAMLNAGLETTANYLANGTFALFGNPDQMRLLRENPGLAPNAAEELLRYDGPAPIMTPQQAVEDVVIGGQLIKKDQLLYPVVGAANRDPARFPDPERLDITREPNGQLGYGFGIHFCIGAALARIEGQTYFSKLVTRFPKLRLDPDKPAPVFRDDPLLRGLETLHVRVD